MSYVYLASPYSDPDPKVEEQRFELVCRFAGEMMRSGDVVYSPIAHSHPIAVRTDLPREWEYWKRVDQEMLRHASALMVLTIQGWEESRGVTEEISIAKAIGLPIYYAGTKETSDGMEAPNAEIF